MRSTLQALLATPSHPHPHPPGDHHCFAGELCTLQERLAAREAQLAQSQQEVSLLQLHVREAQRAQGAAAEAQAAASKALDQQEAELASLRQELKETQVSELKAHKAQGRLVKSCHQWLTV